MRNVDGILTNSFKSLLAATWSALLLYRQCTVKGTGIYRKLNAMSIKKFCRATILKFVVDFLMEQAKDLSKDGAVLGQLILAIFCLLHQQDKLIFMKFLSQVTLDMSCCMGCLYDFYYK